MGLKNGEVSGCLLEVLVEGAVDSDQVVALVVLEDSAAAHLVEAGQVGAGNLSAWLCKSNRKYVFHLMQ